MRIEKTLSELKEVAYLRGEVIRVREFDGLLDVRFLWPESVDVVGVVVHYGCGDQGGECAIDAFQEEDLVVVEWTGGRVDGTGESGLELEVEDLRVIGFADGLPRECIPPVVAFGRGKWVAFYNLRTRECYVPPGWQYWYVDFLDSYWTGVDEGGADYIYFKCKGDTEKQVIICRAMGMADDGSESGAWERLTEATVETLDEPEWLAGEDELIDTMSGVKAPGELDATTGLEWVRSWNVPPYIHFPPDCSTQKSEYVGTSCDFLRNNGVGSGTVELWRQTDISNAMVVTGWSNESSLYNIIGGLYTRHRGEPPMDLFIDYQYARSAPGVYDARYLDPWAMAGPWYSGSAWVPCPYIGGHPGSMTYHIELLCISGHTRDASINEAFNGGASLHIPYCGTTGEVDRIDLPGWILDGAGTGMAIGEKVVQASLTPKLLRSYKIKETGGAETEYGYCIGSGSGQDWNWLVGNQAGLERPYRVQCWQTLEDAISTQELCRYSYGSEGEIRVETEKRLPYRQMMEMGMDGTGYKETQYAYRKFQDRGAGIGADIVYHEDEIDRQVTAQLTEHGQHWGGTVTGRDGSFDCRPVSPMICPPANPADEYEIVTEFNQGIALERKWGTQLSMHGRYNGSLGYVSMTFVTETDFDTTWLPLGEGITLPEAADGSGRPALYLAYRPRENAVTSNWVGKYMQITEHQWVTDYLSRSAGTSSIAQAVTSLEYVVKGQHRDIYT